MRSVINNTTKPKSTNTGNMKQPNQTQTQTKRKTRSSQAKVDNNTDIRRFFKPNTITIAATEEGEIRDQQGLSNGNISNSKSKNLKSFVTKQPQTKHINTDNSKRVLVQTIQSNSRACEQGSNPEID